MAQAICPPCRRSARCRDQRQGAVEPSCYCWAEVETEKLLLVADVQQVIVAEEQEGRESFLRVHFSASKYFTI